MHAQCFYYIMHILKLINTKKENKKWLQQIPVLKQCVSI